ncbi:hypothetical protein [Paraflavitalea sp. CAU 1676]|uniref:hypothetical protein n=1 Tax=Paraflavitalea sp. CAU 1676 TaxID=3032598 RepID=UPI0023DA2850|nr:hypothetical protein [Paraflavitalea sp. CAU 1676]MDF2186787.1 hypothetical protein [Paraflavitalea sp. CAU 1676]
MLKNFTLPSLLLTTLLCNAQTPDILQQRCLGGSGAEGNSNSIRAQVTKDSGYIILTSTQSIDGDVFGLHPAKDPVWSQDIWVVKLNKYGGIQWQKCLGGSGPDIAYAIDTADGNNYFVTGFTQSTDGDIGVARAWTGDAWVAKLGSTGNIIWKNCIGGSRGDEPRAIRSTPDGGCIMAGRTYSNDGDVSGNHNDDANISDAWAVKLSANGTIEWSKCYGSKANDIFRDVLVTKDGNYLLAGSTYGRDGDVSGNHSDVFTIEVSDGWAVKVDRSGKIIWANCYGGNYMDGIAKVKHAADGGYVFAGNSQSTSSEQVMGSHGNNFGSDAWLLKTNAEGGFQWGRCYGGIWEERAVSVAVGPAGYWFVGDCQMSHGDVQGPNNEGWFNIWLGQVSLDGKLV